MSINFEACASRNKQYGFDPKKWLRNYMLNVQFVFKLFAKYFFFHYTKNAILVSTCVTRLIVQYFAIYNNEKLTNIIEKLQNRV